MTPEELDAIRERAEATPKGPWATDEGEVRPWEVVASWTMPFIELDNTAEGIALAQFIARARTDVPALLAEVERLRANLEQARENADWWMNVSGNTAKAWGVERDLYRRGSQLVRVFKAAQRLKEARPKMPGFTYTPNLDDALDAVNAAVEAVDLDAPADRPAHLQPEDLVEVLNWAADELDAQADARGESVLDYTDHLRCFANQSNRVPVVPWPASLARPVERAPEPAQEKP